MKKVLIVLALFILLGVMAGTYVVSKTGLPPSVGLLMSRSRTKTAWQYQPLIKQPITATGGKDKAASLGNLSAQRVTVSVPKGAFDADTGITLSDPKTVPDIVPGEIETIGAPIEISAGKPVRLNDKTTVTFRFDRDKLPPATRTDQLRIAYYNGKKWDYLKPDAVEMANGTMTFTAYHFSIFGAGKLRTDSQITDAWIHTQAVTNQLGASSTPLSNQVASQIITLTMQKMGVTDPDVAKKVESNLIADENFKKISGTYGHDNNAEMNKQIAMLVGTKIAENIPKAVFDNGLKHSGELPGESAAVTKAAAYITEGAYKDAAKVIGEEIADKFLITTAGKIAVIVTQTQIANWKDAEIEAAYAAYKNGAYSYFYGYNADRGDFNAVWDQMRGIRRQLEIDAIAKENTARKEAGLPELTEAQLATVRERVKQSYQNQFTLRSEKETEFAKDEARLKQIVDAFDKAGFLGVTPPAGLDKGYDLETRLDVLNHFAQKMMTDTGRNDMTDKTGLLVDGKLSFADLVQGARYYFGGDKGREDYTKFLADRFGIQPYPKLADMAGKWTGTVTVTAVTIPDMIPQDVKDDLKKEGCEELDFDKIDLQDVKKSMNDSIGKEQAATFTITPTSETGGTISSDAGKSAQAMPFTYAGGIINATATQQGVHATVTLTPVAQGTSLIMTGTMNASIKDLIKTTMAVSVKKQ